METELNMNDIIEQRVALHCSLIGVGNAGNQLLNVAFANGIDVFAINTSAQDMHSALISEQIKSFIIGNEGRGAGKNRKTALEFFKYNGKELLTQVPSFTSMIDHSDVIFVAGSTGGGTGSAICPVLIRYLKQFYPNKIVIYIGILPKKTSAYKEQLNSMNCLAEIIDSDIKIPYILADLDYYSDLPNDVAYTEVQKYLIDCIDVIRGKYINKSPYGMMDENDMRTVISEPGYLSIYNLSNVSQNQLDQKSMQSMMIDLIKNSPAAEITRNGLVKQMGAIINVPDDMKDASRTSNYDELQSYIGKPFALFENYAILPMATTGQMIIILAGQTMPMNRIGDISTAVNDAEKVYSKQKQFNLNDICNSKIVNDSSTQFFIAEEEKDPVQKSSDLSNFFDTL